VTKSRTPNICRLPAQPIRVHRRDAATPQDRQALGSSAHGRRPTNQAVEHRFDSAFLGSTAKPRALWPRKARFPGSRGAADRTGPDEIRGREALKGWISGIHTVLTNLTFAIDVGPITDHEHLVVRWRAHGTYRGGFPGAAPEATGREVTFTGTDTLRIADGKLAEYWANADSLLFLQQLGVREIPAR